jgi:nucleoside-diphosphate-sugar epimerase
MRLWPNSQIAPFQQQRCPYPQCYVAVARMKVFVAGGTGAIGRPTVRALVAAGHEVKALARSPAKAKLVAGLGALPVDVSLFDSTALAEQIKGFDAVVNLATALPNSRDFHRASAWRENFRVRSAGSAAIAASMLATGVPRLVQESVSMIYCDVGCRWVDETWPVDDFPAAASNHAAEAQARAFAKQGGTEIILRFGWFYGPGAAHSEQFLTLARRWGICVMLGPGDTYVSSIPHRRWSARCRSCARPSWRSLQCGG